MTFSRLAIAAAPVAFVLLWSTGFIGARYGLPYIEPMTFLGVRMLCVVAIMLVIALVERRALAECARGRRTASRSAPWCISSISAASSSPSARACRPGSRR